jgi:O-acetyl-ADP-ribose deacetylase (regulator of RNase III)
MKVEVLSGDISRVSANALITAINSGGMWFGGIDGVIQRSCGGNIFHSQAEAAMPLKHGDTVVANSLGLPRKDTFQNVVFVVDDLEGPLHQIVYNGLVAAAKAGFTSVTLPTIRMGVMLGAVEKSVQEATQEMAKGVRKFMAEYPASSLSIVTFVVFRDEPTRAQLEKDLND